MSGIMRTCCRWLRDDLMSESKVYTASWPRSLVAAPPLKDGEAHLVYLGKHTWSTSKWRRTRAWEEGRWWLMLDSTLGRKKKISSPSEHRRPHVPLERGRVFTVLGCMCVRKGLTPKVGAETWFSHCGCVRCSHRGR